MFKVKKLFFGGREPKISFFIRNFSNMKIRAKLFLESIEF